MKLFFFGGDFGIPVLKALLLSPHCIMGIFLPSSNTKNLNPIIKLTEAFVVGSYKFFKGPDPYEELNIKSVNKLIKNASVPVYFPESIKDPEFNRMIFDMHPDLIVSAGYTKIFPNALIQIPKFGCINLHPSLLPRYRGPSPVFWQIVNGEKTTGVTTHFIDEGIDTGNIIYQETVRIEEDETNGELFLRLARLGGNAVLETIRRIENNRVLNQEQEHGDASYYPRMRRENLEIRWTESAETLRNLVRAGNPWPGTYCKLHEGELIVWAAKAIAEIPALANPGSVVRLSKEFVEISTGNGILKITDASFNKKRLSIERIIRKLGWGVGSRLSGSP